MWLKTSHFNRYQVWFLCKGYWNIVCSKFACILRFSIISRLAIDLMLWLPLAKAAMFALCCLIMFNKKHFSSNMKYFLAICCKNCLKRELSLGLYIIWNHYARNVGNLKNETFFITITPNLNSKQMSIAQENIDLKWSFYTKSCSCPFNCTSSYSRHANDSLSAHANN